MKQGFIITYSLYRTIFILNLLYHNARKSAEKKERGVLSVFRYNKGREDLNQDFVKSSVFNKYKFINKLQNHYFLKFFKSL